jgi:ketosteroid isomerase-like protein
MTTRELTERYLEALRDGKEWSDFFHPNMTFISHVVPAKRVEGRPAFLESTRRFYSMIASVEVVALIAEGDRACALTRYQLRSPKGPFITEVAEIFKVEGGKIVSLEIYFDSAPFPK